MLLLQLEALANGTKDVYWVLSEIPAADLTDEDFVSVQLRLLVPASTLVGLGWVASIRVDGVALARATCRPGRERFMTDLAANVSKLAGDHEEPPRG